MAKDYTKIFQDWCRLKAFVHAKHNKTLFKEGEIWWCIIGMNVGYEIYGKGQEFARPVLILKKLTENSLMALPLTLQEKQGSWYVGINTQGVKRWVLLNQARMIDQRRLMRKISSVRQDDLQEIKLKFSQLYGS